MRTDRDWVPSLVAWVSVLVAFAIFVLNRLYRVASRNDVPMFSPEAFSLALPYLIGAALGLLAITGYWLFTRKRKDAQ